MFAGGKNMTFDAANGGVGLGTINKGVPSGIKAQAMATAKKVAQRQHQGADEVLAEPELLGEWSVGGGPSARPRTFHHASGKPLPVPA